MIIGSKIRDLLNLRGLRLNADPVNCNECKACTLNCPMNLDVHTNIKLNKLNHTECLLCGNCVDHCKRNAIFFSFGNENARY